MDICNVTFQPCSPLHFTCELRGLSEGIILVLISMFDLCLSVCIVMEGIL